VVPLGSCRLWPYFRIQTRFARGHARSFPRLAKRLGFNGHVNNGRYLALADIGRIHWFVRTGVLGVARRHNAFPIVGDAIAKFRQDLRLFQRFEIHTRLIGWDCKWGFLEHRFVRNDRVIGVVAIAASSKGPGGPLDPGILLAGVAHSAPSPELPEWANRFSSGRGITKRGVT
jgi:acyl-CoA thioesterase FadM